MAESESFHEQLRAARKRGRLSQAALGERLGMRQSQVSNLETGRYPISETTAHRWAAALGLTVSLKFSRPK